MKKSDVWDTVQASQRGSNRYLARWKVALVFDNATNKPIFQTLTNDLSASGISLQYHSEEKVHTILTLLLAPPPVDGINQKIIKLKAVIMSSIPFRGSFRLGMNFIQGISCVNVLESMRFQAKAFLPTQRVMRFRSCFFDPFYDFEFPGSFESNSGQSTRTLTFFPFTCPADNLRAASRAISRATAT
jgi:hypothetical protein